MMLIMLTLLAAGQAGKQAGKDAAATAIAAPQTMQQRFDAASMAAAEGRCVEALAGFEQVEKSSAMKRNALLAAAVDVRKGVCLVATGRAADGEPMIRRGLPTLAARRADFAADVRSAHLSLGAAARMRFDYDAAAAEYRAAAEGVGESGRVVPLMQLSRVTMFDRDGKALAAAEEARRIVIAHPDMFGRKDVATVQTQYARVLLNEGRAAEAYGELRDSLAKQGGLTMRVSLGDIVTRSDLAIAALQSGDRDNARKYLAYSGAGHMKDAPFGRAAAMTPPACGGAAGLTRDDRAIVEFTLEEDGRVTGVSPIVATGNRAKALAFAQAVADWSWRAEDAKNVPALFRYVTRVELRCVAAQGLPDSSTPLREAAIGWLQRKAGAPPAWADLSAAAALPLQKAALQRSLSTGSHAQAAEAALALVDSPVTNQQESVGYLSTAAKEVDAAGAPPAVHAFVALRGAMLAEGDPAPAMRRILADPQVEGDPLSRTTVRMMLATMRRGNRWPDAAPTLLDAVIEEPGLDARHALKIAAMLQKANLLASRGDAAGARAVFDRTGLTAGQCAAMDLQPAMRSAGSGTGKFPQAAQQWGFEGWVRTEFDVTADGRTVAQRAVISYPPFVFDDAAVGIARNSHYARSYRPDGALACAGNQINVAFRLP